MRLDKLLSNLGYCSRRDADNLARNGTVLVAGERVRLANIEVDPKEVTFDGEELDPGQGIVVMLHKPVGYTCSHKDQGELVMDLLPPRFGQRKPPLAMVGRLDKETSGLLLLTDDGQLLHRLTSPKHHVAKIYRVVLENPLSGEESRIFGSGTMMLDEEEEPLLPAEFKPLDSNCGLITLHEGRYHQIRRMFAAIDNCVAALHREQVAELRLGDLECGEFRILDRGEIETKLLGALT